MQWISDRLSEPSTWNSLSIILGGTGGYLATHGFPDVSVYVCAIGAGASALAGFIMKEKGSAQ